MRDRRYAELTKTWRDVVYWNVTGGVALFALQL
jgi:hypothetical protein